MGASQAEIDAVSLFTKVLTIICTLNGKFEITIRRAYTGRLLGGSTVDKKFDLAKLIAQAAKTGPDMTQVKASAEYTPPAEGPARARLVGYFELGKHEEENMQGKMVLRDKVDLVFELSGPNHQPRKLDDGTLIPHRVTVQETLSLEHRANFRRLFALMNAVHGNIATHMAQFLGKPFMFEVFHRPSKDGKKMYANLKGPNGYLFYHLAEQDAITGKTKAVLVDPALTELRAFFWDLASPEMWDSIYIPGDYEERKNDKGEVIAPARSKNVLQERTMKAKNWPELAARLGVSPVS